MKKIISTLLIAAMLTAGASAAVAAETPSAEGGLAIKEGAMLKLDDASERLILMDGKITVAELMDGFVSPVTVTDHSGAEKTGADPAASGDIVSSGDSSAEVLLYGDVDRDGDINLSDVVLVLKSISGYEVDIDNAAADVEPGDGVNTADAVKMLRYSADWAVSLGNIRMVAANEPKTAEFEDSSIGVFFETPLRKVARSVTESTGKNTYTMKLARNETESTQMFLTAEKNYSDLSIELSDFEYEFGEHSLKGEILWEYYYELSLAENILFYEHDKEGTVSDNKFTRYYNDYYVDPLPPVAETFELVEGRSQGFMINVTSDKDAPAGLYRATVDLKNSDGQVIKSAYVYAYVWDFTLPDTPYSVSAFGTGSFVTAGSTYDPYPEYYEFMLQNNLSPYRMPYLITDPRANAIMDDPRVTSFIIAGSGNGGVHDRTDEEIIASYKILKDNPEWFQKAYFYFVDEPSYTGMYRVGEQYDRLKNLVGDEDFRVVVPLAHDTIVDSVTGLDAVEYMYKNKLINIWCPQSMAFVDCGEYTYIDPNFTPTRAYHQYGSMVKRMEEIRDDPETDFWWYICCQPQYPWPNFFNNYQGNMNRVVLWQQYMLKIEGLLYWAVSNWANVSKYKTESDGCLIYWRELFGFDAGPVSSYRMVQVRDGFDDFDYMKMAEELYGYDAVMEVVNTVTTGVLQVNEDADAMIAARDVLGEMLDGNYD